MNIEKVISHPLRYTDKPKDWELEALYAQEEEEWQQQASGKFWIRAELYWRKYLGVSMSATERRNAAQVVSSVLGKRVKFQRMGDYYKIDEWVITNRSITSGFFDIENRTKSLEVLAALDKAGYRMHEGLSIYYRPESFGIEGLTALVTMAQRELKRLKEKLELSEEPLIGLERGGLELYVSMERLQYEELAECLLLFYKLIRLSGSRLSNTIAG